ncbi:MAG: hypothetical protein HY438_00205 [DPANN group archaeon]|nr:hypothetical protein [DPANN group archaeon]
MAKPGVVNVEISINKHLIADFILLRDILRGGLTLSPSAPQPVMVRIECMLNMLAGLEGRTPAIGLQRRLNFKERAEIADVFELLNKIRKIINKKNITEKNITYALHYADDAIILLKRLRILELRTN